MKGNSNLRVGAFTRVCFLLVTSRWIVLPSMAEFDSNCGTEGNEPCKICTYEDLRKVDKNGADKHYVMMNDIRARGNFVPIGSDSRGFRGIFDGDGHTIHDLHIDYTVEHGHGLFGHASRSAKIHNLILRNPIVRSHENAGALVGFVSHGEVTIQNVIIYNPTVTGELGVGALVGQIEMRRVHDYSEYMEFSISNCHVFGGTVNGTRNFSRVGGLVGDSNHGIIKECSTESVEVKGNGVNSDCGGLVGRLGFDGVIDNSFATGSVRDCRYAGGLVGDSVTGASITNSYALGDIYAVEYIHGRGGGGLVGGAHKSDIHNSFAIGAVSGKGTIELGGLLGSWVPGKYTTVRNNYCVMDPAVGNYDVEGINDVQVVDDPSYFFNEENEPMVGWNRSVWKFAENKYPTHRHTMELSAGGPYRGIVGEAIYLNQAVGLKGAKYFWTVDNSKCTLGDDEVLHPVLTCRNMVRYPATVGVCVKIIGRDLFRDCTDVAITARLTPSFPVKLNEVTCVYASCVGKVLRKYGGRTKFGNAQSTYKESKRKAAYSKNLIQNHGKASKSLRRLKEAMAAIEELRKTAPEFANTIGKISSGCAVSLVDGFLEAYRGQGILDEDFLDEVRDTKLVVAKAKRKAKQWNKSVVYCSGAIWKMMNELGKETVPVC